MSTSNKVGDQYTNNRSHYTVMGSTPDGLPHVGRVPGSMNQWLLAGFNGAGMLMIFTTSQAIAKMAVEGVEYESTGLPRLFKSTLERLLIKASPPSC